MISVGPIAALYVYDNPLFACSARTAACAACTSYWSATSSGAWGSFCSKAASESGASFARAALAEKISVKARSAAPADRAFIMLLAGAVWRTELLRAHTARRRHHDICSRLYGPPRRCGILLLVEGD